MRRVTLLESNVEMISSQSDSDWMNCSSILSADDTDEERKRPFVGDDAGVLLGSTNATENS